MTCETMLGIGVGFGLTLVAYVLGVISGGIRS